jgi:hypothetical protein
MKLSGSFTDAERVVRHIKPVRFFGWFVAIFLPIALAMSIFIQWRNAVVGPPQPREVVLRSIIAAIVFFAGGVVHWWFVFRPAFRAASQEKLRR